MHITICSFNIATLITNISLQEASDIAPGNLYEFETPLIFPRKVLHKLLLVAKKKPRCYVQ